MLSYNVQTLCYDICVKIFDVKIFQRNINISLRNKFVRYCILRNIKSLLSLASMDKYR